MGNRIDGSDWVTLAHLELLRASVTDWRDSPDQDEYVAGLRKIHGRKWSFWQSVDS